MAKRKRNIDIEQKYLEERKNKVNNDWDELIALPVRQIDQDEFIRLMEEMNSIDKMIIRHGRRELLC